MQRRSVVGIVSIVFFVSFAVALTLAFTIPKKQSAIDASDTENLIKVTPLNFARAETNEVMRSIHAIGLLNGDGGLNQFTHYRSASNSDFPIVRPNTDTLYSTALLDTYSGPVQITLPKVEDRYMSIECTNEDHYVEFYSKAPAVFHLQRETVATRYIFCIIRTALKTNDEDDHNQIAGIQDRVTIKAPDVNISEPLDIPDYDHVTRMEIQQELRYLFTKMPNNIGMFGERQNTDDIAHLLGVAGGFGGLPENLALYLTEIVPTNDGDTDYVINVNEVPTNAFWSITVYDVDGFMFADVDSVAINSYRAEKNDDGSYTINFSNDENKINNINIASGWNYCVRVYEPQKSIINGDWTFPTAAAVPESYKIV